jgi:hypothetical protein
VAIEAVRWTNHQAVSDYLLVAHHAWSAYGHPDRRNRLAICAMLI